MRGDGNEQGHGSQRTVCATCGDPLRRAPSQLKERNYCSLYCRDHDPDPVKRKQRVDAGTRKSDWVEKPCAFCGKPVQRRVTDSRARHFCDRFCAARMPRKRGRGAGRPRGRTPGSRKVFTGGYVDIFVGYDDPMARASGFCLEHRYVMSQLLGRPLLPDENVHHKNGDQSDNHPDNLELWVTKQPKGQRPVDLLEWAETILATYGPIREKLAEV
jgi:endogenous inhibitor of DNA gyrase (YacG/DUF329 family)